MRNPVGLTRTHHKTYHAILIMNIHEYLGDWPQRTLVTVKTQKQGFMFSPCKTYKYYSDAKSFFLFYFILIINLYDKTPTVYIYIYILVFRGSYYVVTEKWSNDDSTTHLNVRYRMIVPCVDSNTMMKWARIVLQQETIPSFAELRTAHLKIMHNFALVCLRVWFSLGWWHPYDLEPLLLTWIKFNPSMDKWSHVQCVIILLILSQTSTIATLKFGTG